MKDSKWKAIWTSCVLRHNIQPFNFNLVNLRRVGWWRWGHQCQAPCVKKYNHSHSSSRGDCCDCPFLLSCKSQWHWLIRKNMETTFCFRATPQHAIRICSRERSGYYQVLHARRSTRCGQCPEKLMYHAPVWTQQATCPVHTGLGFACCCRGLALDSENWTLEQQRPNDNVIARPLLLQSPELAGKSTLVCGSVWCTEFSGLDLPVVAEGWLWTLESGLWSSKGHSYVSYWRPLLLQSPELAELVDDGGFVLQGVRIATWKSSSSWHVTWNPSNLSLACRSTPSQTSHWRIQNEQDSGLWSSKNHANDWSGFNCVRLQSWGWGRIFDCNLQHSTWWIFAELVGDGEDISAKRHVWKKKITATARAGAIVVIVLFCCPANRSDIDWFGKTWKQHFASEQLRSMPSGFVPENGLVITKFFMRAVQQDVDSALRNLWRLLSWLSFLVILQIDSEKHGNKILLQSRVDSVSTRRTVMKNCKAFGFVLMIHDCQHYCHCTRMKRTNREVNQSISPFAISQKHGLFSHIEGDDIILYTVIHIHRTPIHRV